MNFVPLACSLLFWGAWLYALWKVLVRRDS